MVVFVSLLGSVIVQRTKLGVLIDRTLGHWNGPWLCWIKNIYAWQWCKTEADSRPVLISEPPAVDMGPRSIMKHEHMLRERCKKQRPSNELSRCAEFVSADGGRPLADLLRSQSLDEFTWRDTDTWILKYIIEIYWMSFNSQYEELAWFVHLSMQKPIYQKYIKIYSIQKKHDSLSQSEPSHLFHIVGLWVSCDCPRLNSR